LDIAIFILVLFFLIAFVQSSHQAAKSINLCVCVSFFFYCRLLSVLHVYDNLRNK